MRLRSTVACALGGSLFLAGCQDRDLPTAPPLLTAAAADHSGSGWSPGAVVDLGFGGYATALNDAGQVVAHEYGSNRGILWDNGDTTHLGSLSGEPGTIPYAINNNGQVTGYSSRVVEGVGVRIRAFRWDAGTMTELGLLEGGTTSIGFGINHSGQVVGFSTWSGSLGDHAVLWNGVTPTPLGALCETYCVSRAYAVNDLGQVVGFSTSNQGSRAVLWQGGSMTNLGVVDGAHGSTARAINNAGQVVGNLDGSTNGSSWQRAFIWQNGTMTSISPLSGDNNSIATGINEHGQVSGYSWGGANGRRAFVWEAGSATPLESLGGTSSEALGINEHGQVAGQSYNGSRNSPALWSAAIRVPLSPTGLAAGPVGAARVDLAWTDASTNESRYELSRRMRNSDGTWGPYTVLPVLPQNAAAATDSNLVSGKTYQFRLRACHDLACSPWVLSPSVVLLTAPVAPSAPQGTIVTPTRIQVRWSDLSGNETRFELARRMRNADGTWGSYAVLPNPAANATGAADTTAVTTNIYQYRLRACNAAGCSAWILGAAVMVPAAPIGLTMTPTSAARINLHWVDRATNEERFELARRQRNTDGSYTPFSALPNRLPNTEGYADLSVSPATTYQYRVRACNASGCSPWLLGSSAATPAG